MNYKLQKSYRKKGYDYTLNGAYFITICTKDRKYYFGSVENFKMILSPISKITVKYWLEIPQHFENIRLDEFIIMPNHIHGIIILENLNQSAFKDCVFDCRNAPRRVHQNHQTDKNTPRRVPTGGLKPLIKGSISSIINHFKGNVKRYCNKNGFEYFFWQPRFHDRIIRNEQELYNIQNYIYFNPDKWEYDRNNLESLFM